MTVSTRLFRDDDYPDFARVRTSIDTEERRTVEESQHADREVRSAGYDLVRLVAEVAGSGIVGYGHAVGREGRYVVTTAVHADVRRGVGSRLFHGLMEVLRSTWIDATNGMAHAFLDRHGFRVVEQAWDLRLDVASVDVGAFVGFEERVAGHGITVTTLAAEHERHPGCSRSCSRSTTHAAVTSPRRTSTPCPSPSISRTPTWSAVRRAFPTPSSSRKTISATSG